MRIPFSAIAALLSITSLVNGQTYTVCDPTKTSCPPDPALGKTITTDFTNGFTDDWTYVNGSEGLVSYNSSGANFVITQKNEAPTMVSSKYIMFGRVSATIKASHGTGIVSAFILLSDDLDEIDWEWLGGSDDTVQTNIFRQGTDGATNLATFAKNPSNQEAWHTYTLDWTATALTWYIDNVPVRTVHYSDFDGTTNRYPQTPMQVHMGSWIGCPDAAAAADPATAGRCAWAGGPADWSQAPYNMQIKSVTIEDYGCAKEYVYGDKSGTWQSIQSVGTCDKNAASTTTTTSHSKTSTPTPTASHASKSTSCKCSDHTSTTKTSTTKTSTTKTSTTKTSTTETSTTKTSTTEISTTETSTTETSTTKRAETTTTHSVKPPVTTTTTTTTKSSYSATSPTHSDSETTKSSSKPHTTPTTSTKSSYIATSPTHSDGETYPVSTPSKSPTSVTETPPSESNTWTVGGTGHDATSGVESYVVSTVTSTYVSIQSSTIEVYTNTEGATETTTIIPETTTLTTTTTVTSTVELVLSTPTAVTSPSNPSSTTTANPLTINPIGTGSFPTGTGTPTTFSYTTTSTKSTESASASVSPIVKAGDAQQLRGSSALALFLCAFYLLI